MRPPSGLQCGLPRMARFPWRTRARALPVPRSMIHRNSGPSRFERNAIRPPSGEGSAWYSVKVFDLRRRGSPPVAGTSQSCHMARAHRAEDHVAAVSGPTGKGVLGGMAGEAPFHPARGMHEVDVEVAGDGLLVNQIGRSRCDPAERRRRQGPLARQEGEDAEGDRGASRPGRTAHLDSVCLLSPRLDDDRVRVHAVHPPHEAELTVVGHVHPQQEGIA